MPGVKLAGSRNKLFEIFNRMVRKVTCGQTHKGHKGRTELAISGRRVLWTAERPANSEAPGKSNCLVCLRNSKEVSVPGQLNKKKGN